ncbi:MAG: glycosyltransferase family 39 protein, partial [Phycisphaerae bacterium]
MAMTDNDIPMPNDESTEHKHSPGASRPSASAGISRARALTWLLLILVWAGGWRALFLQGWAASDDAVYVSCAIALSQGELLTFDGQPLVDNRAARVSYLSAVAAWMALFGKSDTALCSLDVVCGVASLAALYWVGSLTGGRRVGLWAAGLKAVYPPDLVYNGLVFPDHFGLLFVLLAMGAFLTVLLRQSKRVWPWILAGGFAMAVAVSARESAFLLGLALPVVGLLASGRRGLTLGVAVGAAGLAFFSLDFIVLHAATGDWLYRVHAAQASFGQGGLHHQGFSWGKLLYYPYTLLVRQSATGLYGWLLLAGLIWALGRRPRYRLVLIWTALSWLFMEFGSTSPTSYQPMPKGIRLMAPMTVLLFIPWAELAVMVAKALRRARWAFYAGVIGVLYHGLFTANQAAQPLYWADHSRSVHAAVIAQARDDTPPLMLPQSVYRNLSPADQAAFVNLDRIDLSGQSKDLPTPGSMLYATRRHSLVIPIQYFKLMGIQHRHGRVTPEQYRQYLDTHAQAIPLIDRPRPLDRVLM